VGSPAANKEGKVEVELGEGGGRKNGERRRG